MKKMLKLILCVTMIFCIASQYAFAAPSAVSKFNITVTEPKAGEKPVNTGSVPSTASSYVDKVEWNGELDSNGCFKEGVAYTALVTVKLKPNQNKEIKVVKGKATVNGNEAELYQVSEDKQSGVVKYKFAEIPKKPVVDADGNSSFVDVKPDDYFASAVNWAIRENITAGTSSTTFSPDAICTKAQILTFIWRAVGAPKHEGVREFLDVNESDYFYDAAHWARSKNMSSGLNFEGNKESTRSDVIFYLWKNAGCPKDVYDGRFTDVPKGVGYEHAVAWAVNQGITSGTTETTFSPRETCTRGQIVTFLLRAFN